MRKPLETTLSANAGINNSITGSDSGVLQAGGRYTDRPTITYVPKTGEAYLRSLLEPVEPRALLSLVLAGYSSKLLFTWAVESVNGMRKYSVSDQKAKKADPEFLEFVQNLRRRIMELSGLNPERGSAVQNGVHADAVPDHADELRRRREHAGADHSDQLSAGA